MTIAFDMLLLCAREVDETYEGDATGGSVTTLLDTAQVEPDGYWSNGTLFFLTGNRANTTAAITSYRVAGTARTFTFPTGLACAAGNRYLALAPKWPKSAVLRALNIALSLQTVRAEDETTAVTASTKAYTLPSDVSDVYCVEYGNDTDGWKTSYTWKEEGGEIRFSVNEPTDTSHYLRLIYRSKPATITADSATIEGDVNLDWLHMATMLELFKWRNTLTKGNDKPAMDMIKYYEGRAERARKYRPQNTPHYTGW